jgi:hypothetical protein
MNLKWKNLLLSSVAREAEGAGAGGGGEPWYKPLNLAPENVAFIEERKFPDLNTAFQTARESHRMASSRNVLERPAEGKINEWKGWSELGWKEKPEEYQFKALDDKAKQELGFEYDSALWDHMRQVAHKHRVPLHQAQAIHDDMLGFVKQRVGDTTAQGALKSQELATALKTEWGADYERKTEIAKRTAKVLGFNMDDLAQVEKFVGAPTLLRKFAMIGEKLGEANLVGGADSGGGDLPASVEGIRASINAFKADENKRRAMGDPMHAQHAAVKAEWQKLIERLAAAEKKQAA